MTVAGLDARMRAAWRSYLWRDVRTARRRWTLQVAREPGVYTVGVEVRPDVTHLHVTARVGVLAVTVGVEPR